MADNYTTPSKETPEQYKKRWDNKLLLLKTIKNLANQFEKMANGETPPMTDEAKRRNEEEWGSVLQRVKEEHRQNEPRNDA